MSFYRAKKNFPAHINMLRHDSGWLVHLSAKSEVPGRSQ